MDDLPWWLLPLVVLVLAAGGWLLSRRSRQEPTESQQDWQSTRLHPPSAIDSRQETAPAPLTEEAHAAEAAALALREAQDSARRELAEREDAARDAAALAAAQAAAEREAAERDAATRLEAELAARREADRLAEEARQRAADAQAQAEQARQAEAERQAAEQRARERQAADAARLQAEQEARAREAEFQAEFERLQAQQKEIDRAEAERLEAEAARQIEARAEAQRLEDERLQAEQAAAAAALAAADAAAARRASEAAAAAAPPLPPSAPPARRADQTLVMVVDDSKVVRVKTSRLLAAHQFRVALAEDGQAALDVIAREAPQVLITDVEMPGMDGLSLTRAVRADTRTATLPVVMITSADDRLKDEATAAGVTVLMGKPYTDHELVGHVARLAGVTLQAWSVRRRAPGAAAHAAHSRHHHDPAPGVASCLDLHDPAELPAHPGVRQPPGQPPAARGHGRLVA